MYIKKQLCNARNNEDSVEIRKNDIIGMSKTFKNSNISADEMLEELIGIESVKEQLYEIITQIEHALKHKNVESPCIHMRFVGNPGTGKTTVARILGKMLGERGILRNGNFFEYSGRDLCGRYIGETALKTAGICRDAYGSVLFIDEAYSLYTGDNDTKDFGREALTTLIAEMENHRNDLVVIMAGYRDDMSVLMKGNVGLESRMPFVIDFKNYSRDDLAKIFMQMVKKANFEADSDLGAAVKDYFDSLPDEVLQAKDFSNARFVRNLFERTWGKAASRCRIEKHDNIVLRADDLQKATDGSTEINLNTKKKQRIGF